MSSPKTRYSSNEYLRMMNMISLLQEIDEGMSVSELAEKYQLPTAIILEDLWYMHNSEQLALHVEPADLELDTEEFLNELFCGMQNATKLIASIPYQNHTGKISVQLTRFEHMVLDEFLRYYYAAYTPAMSEIQSKKIIRAFSKQQMNDLHSIQNAIEKKLLLKMVYLTKAKELISFQCAPIKTVKTIANELVYLIAMVDGVQMYYRLDRIKRLEVLSKQHDIAETVYQEITKEFDYRWGMGPYEEPFPFLLQVFDEADLPRRLQKELNGRKYGKWEMNEDGSYLYQDLVIDYASLKQWVLSLGSSVKVMEPKQLAQDIKMSAQKRMETYREQLQS